MTRAISSTSIALPRVRGVPMLGALPTLLREQFSALERWHQQHGDVFVVPLGPTDVVFVTSPEVAGEMMVDKGRNFVRGGPAWDSLRTVIGTGMLGNDGDVWRERRRMMQPQFHTEGLRKLFISMAEAVDEICELWTSNFAGGQLLDMEQRVPQMTMAVILRAVFGARLSDQNYDKFSEQLQLALDRVALGWVTHKLPRWLPIPGRSAYRRALEEIERFVLEMAEQRRVERRYADDLLGMLVSLNDGGELDFKGLRDESVSLFVAGYETAANTLGFVLWELACRPELVAALREEADRVLGPKGSAPIRDINTVRELVLAEQVFREGLRMYPGAIWLPRVAVEDDTLGGMPIRAGTTTVVSIYSIHHDPNLWDEPYEFRPERHAPDAPPLRHRNAWMPFGLGQHMCIGQRLAMAEGPLVLARICQYFDLEADRERPPEPRMSTAITTKNGIWMRIAPH